MYNSFESCDWWPPLHQHTFIMLLKIGAILFHVELLSFFYVCRSEILAAIWKLHFVANSKSNLALSLRLTILLFDLLSLCRYRLETFKGLDCWNIHLSVIDEFQIDRESIPGQPRFRSQSKFTRLTCSPFLLGFSCSSNIVCSNLSYFWLLIWTCARSGKKSR
jgi:hypothetical protein